MLKTYKTILLLAYPLFLGQLGNIAVGFADNIMVGHYSTAALASASFVNNVYNVANLACLGFTLGLTPLVGAFFARKDADAIGRNVRLALRINTLFSFAVIAVMTAFYFNLHRLGQPAELLPLIRPYYLTALAGLLPISIFNLFAQWSYGINRTGLPTWILLACNALNVVGNYFLIYGSWGAPELGLLGAGISTLLSRIVATIVIVAYFFRSKVGAEYLPGFRHSAPLAGEGRIIFTTGFPVAMQMAFETGSFSGSAIFAGWLGTVPLAAFQIVVISGMLGFCVYYSIGAALAIPLSQAMGRNDMSAVRRTAWGGYHIMLVTMITASCLFIFAGKFIMGLFTTDAAVLTLATSLIFPMVLYQFGDATQVTFANALRGTARSMPMLYIAFVSYIIVGLPASYICGFTFGGRLYGIVMSFSICLMLAAGLYFRYFLRATRKL